MARYDIETLLTDVQSFLQANLPTQITSMNSEKSDSISLSSINNAAYFYQTMNEKIASYDPFLYLGVSNITTVGIGPATSKEVTIQVIIAMSDVNGDNNIVKKIFRYSRILEDLFHSKWDRFSNSQTLKINSLAPVTLDLLNGIEMHKAGGVELVTVLS